MLPEPPQGLAPRDRENLIRHFKDRAEAEARYFQAQPIPECETLEVAPADLNSRKSAGFIKGLKPDLVLVFGCGLIKEPLASALPEHTINMHLGLSPRYRGSATLFWPFYFLEPTYAGATFLYIVAEPDAGRIVHQVVPELKPGDGIHDVACRTVLTAAEEARELVRLFAEKGPWEAFVQKATGKNFLSTDFKPAHLRVIYDLFDNDLVDHYLEGRIASPVPKLRRQF